MACMQWLSQSGPYLSVDGAPRLISMSLTWHMQNACMALLGICVVRSSTHCASEAVKVFAWPGLQEETFLRLAQDWLGSIPPVPEPAPVAPDSITPLDYEFPAGVIRKKVR